MRGMLYVYERKSVPCPFTDVLKVRQLPCACTMRETDAYDRPHRRHIIDMRPDGGEVYSAIFLNYANVTNEISCVLVVGITSNAKTVERVRQRTYTARRNMVWCIQCCRIYSKHSLSVVTPDELFVTQDHLPCELRTGDPSVRARTASFDKNMDRFFHGEDK